jgi:Ca-activated chloride channel family protein
MAQQKETFERAVKLKRADENKRAAEKREIDRLSSQPSIAAPKVTRQSQDYAIMPPAPAVTMGRPFALEAPASRSALSQKRFSGTSGLSGHRRITKPDLPAPGYYEDQGRDRFENVASNPVKVVSEDPVSTFSIDVDTASYSFMRSSLNSNVLPQKAAIRVEELINYFPYDYARPDDKSVPFKASVSVFPSPWNTDRKLMHIGIAGFDLKAEEKPHSNLVFLLDTSGSMNAPNKLPLVVNSMKLLLETLHPDDTVAIVTYAGNAGTALEPTQVKDKAKILQALNRLNSRGSTAGAEGIRQAYELAQQSFKKQGVNRVILATDGDFNVGITDRNELKSYVERQRKTGIFLSVLGFGRGNYNDALMQTLAQNGNGNAAYIDTLNEARKVLVEEASSTLFPIAKDVKLQVEFNPLKIAEYRLIGYETRMLKRQDFNNDKVDAGDIGAGHRVTALYEITPVGSKSPSLDTLRYGSSTKKPAAGKTDEYGFLKIRYKLPKEDTSKLITTPVGSGSDFASIKAAPNEARFATAVAAFGQILKGGQHTGAYSYDDVIALAQSAKGKDEFGYRSEFINLVRLAKSAPGLGTLKPR